MKRFGLLRMLLFVAVVMIGATGCVTPTSFIRTLEPMWATIEVRDDVTYEAAWNTLTDLLVKRFDLQTLSRTDGYVRTNWLYTWTGKVTQQYRVRVIAKFSPDRKRLEIKSEAEFQSMSEGWVPGYDTRLLTTLKGDIMGTIGRTSR